MAIDRVVYTNSAVDIKSAVTASTAIRLDTVQNATYTVNVPRENVNTLGAKGTVFRPQLDAADASIEFSLIPAVSGSPDWSPAVADAYLDNTLAQDPSGDEAEVDALGLGSIERGLMNSLTSEATVGAMANMTVSFTGAPSSGAPLAALGSPGAITTLTLVQSKDVTVANSDFASACVQSASTAWDVPVVNVLCLGSDPAVPANINPFGNPPGTASHTIEGLDTALRHNDGTGSTANNYTLSIGMFDFKITGGFVDSETNSVAVGDVFATFNYVIGGTGDSYGIS